MRTILFICIAALLTSCATSVKVTKRKHRGGWHVSVSNNTQNIIAEKKGNPLKKNVTATKQSIVPDNLATEIQLIDSVVVKRRSLKIDSRKWKRLFKGNEEEVNKAKEGELKNQDFSVSASGGNFGSPTTQDLDEDLNSKEQGIFPVLKVFWCTLIILLGITLIYYGGVIIAASLISGLDILCFVGLLASIISGAVSIFIIWITSEPNRKLTRHYSYSLIDKALMITLFILGGVLAIILSSFYLIGAIPLGFYLVFRIFMAATAIAGLVTMLVTYILGFSTK